MKTNELIKQLRAVDPEGILEVTVGNAPIRTIERLPGYYDGPYQKLIEEPKDSPYYNVRGGIVSREGEKIKTGIWTIEDALFDAVADGDEFPIYYEGFDGEPTEADDYWEGIFNNVHKEAREFYEESSERKARLEEMKNENNKN